MESKYLKKYGGLERIKKFALLVFPTLLSGFTLLLSSTYQRKWHKILCGTSLKSIYSPKDLMTIHKVLAKSESDVTIEQSKREIFQEKLKENNLNKINCKNPSPLINKNHIIKEEIEAYLSEFNGESKKLIFELFQAVNMLTFDQLQTGLRDYTLQLKNLLGNEPYIIGFAPGKSQQWLADLALPYLDHTPSSAFTFTTDNGGVNSFHHTNEKNIVIFDDACYTGMQLNSILQSLKRNLPCNQNDQIYLVIPVLSSAAQALLQENVNYEAEKNVDEPLRTQPKKI